MSYQVIARKYRPQRFADVVGQDHVTQTLTNAIQSGRIAHGYLFCGPRGTGKTTLARIFAKALNCTGGPKAEWDEADPRAREITEGRSLDVMEIDGASNNGVEQVRELRETARFAPAASKFKIYLIDEVHMLSTAAFNALLKTLEEPPAHVKFLFATTDPEKVLPTILSRCQRFDLRRIPAALIAKQLGWICSREGVQIDDAALHAIARSADGGMRDAESTLDQLISFCGKKVTEPDVIGMFGLAARAQVVALAEAIIAGDSTTVLRGLDALARSGKDLGRLLSDLLNHFRNLLLFRLSGGDPNLVEASEAEMVSLRTQSDCIEVEALTRVLESLSAAEGRQREAVSKRIYLEVALLKAVQARQAMSLDTVLKQLRVLREEAGSSPGPRPAVTPPPLTTPSPTSPPPPSPPSPPIPKAAPPVSSSLPAGVPSVVVSAALVAAPLVPALLVAAPLLPLNSSAAAPAKGSPPPPVPASAATQSLPEIWAALRASLGPTETGLSVTLESCQPQSLAKGLLTIAHPEDVDPGTPRNVAALKSKFEQMGLGRLDLAFVPLATAAPVLSLTAVPAPKPKSAPAVPPSPSAAVPLKAKPSAPTLLDKDDFLNDPLIKQALEIFKGRLLEVRAGSTPERSTE